MVVKNLRPVHTNWGDATFKPENRVEEGMERLDVDQLWRDRKLYADVTIICQGQGLRNKEYHGTGKRTLMSVIILMRGQRHLHSLYFEQIVSLVRLCVLKFLHLNV